MSISWTSLRIFHNLIHMELRYDHDIFCDKNGTWLLGMLPHFPKLQHFIIQVLKFLIYFLFEVWFHIFYVLKTKYYVNCWQVCGNTKNVCYNCWKHPFTVPECISSELKTCCIRGYDGTKYEFEFAKYILQHSKVLETMIINTTCHEKYQMLQELSLCTRGSTTCKLVFDWSWHLTSCFFILFVLRFDYYVDPCLCYFYFKFYDIKTLLINGVVCYFLSLWICLSIYITKYMYLSIYIFLVTHSFLSWVTIHQNFLLCTCSVLSTFKHLGVSMWNIICKFCMNLIHILCICACLLWKWY
jgi:hypothetical protein